MSSPSIFLVTILHSISGTSSTITVCCHLQGCGRMSPRQCIAAIDNLFLLWGTVEGDLTSPSPRFVTLPRHGRTSPLDNSSLCWDIAKESFYLLTLNILLLLLLLYICASTLVLLPLRTITLVHLLNQYFGACWTNISVPYYEPILRRFMLSETIFHQVDHSVHCNQAD